MKALKTFTIAYASLADGEHFFDYQIDSKFLTHFEAALVQEAALEVQLHLSKFLGSLELNFKVAGTVQTPCDICSEEFSLPIEGAEQILVKIVPEIPLEQDEYNVVYIQESMHSINIAEMLYELIMLSIPMRKVHSEDENGHPTCDPSVLQYLQKDQDVPDDNDEGDDDDNINPIWDELKKLK